MSYSNIKFEKESVFLVTGGAGFIGSNIIEALLRLNYRVRCLDDFSTGKRENIKDFIDNDLFVLIEGSICNYKTCEEAVDSVDYVIHQAAWGSIPRSIKMPLVYDEINIHGTLNMMEASSKAGVKKFVYASSSSVYGDEMTLPKKEGREGSVLAPYPVTKAVNEMYAKVYSDLYNLETVGLRYFNVFGKRQDPFSTYAAVIPLFVKLIMDGKSPTINGDGSYSRDFTYIENVIEANLKACLSPRKSSGKAYNIAYGKRATLNELYGYLCEFLDSDIKATYGPSREGDIPHSLADISNARQYLGYDPDYSLYEGLEIAIKWYKENI